MKKASLIFIAIFLIFALFSCNEGSKATKDGDLAAAGSEVSDDNTSGSSSSNNSKSISSISSEGSSSTIKATSSYASSVTSSAVSSATSSSTSSETKPKDGTNIALNKKYSVTGIYTDPSTEKVKYGDSETGKLTDGNTGSKVEDISYASPLWVGLNTNAKDSIRNSNINNITIDLGKTEQKLQKFVLFTEECGGGVMRPKSIEVFISEDGMTFTSVGKAQAVKILNRNSDESAEKDYGIYTYTVSAPKDVSARYVKFMISHSGNWVFVSEAQVFQGK